MIPSHLNVLTFFPSDWGMLRRSRCDLIFLLKLCTIILLVCDKTILYDCTKEYVINMGIRKAVTVERHNFPVVVGIKFSEIDNDGSS